MMSSFGSASAEGLIGTSGRPRLKSMHMDRTTRGPIKIKMARTRRSGVARAVIDSKPRPSPSPEESSKKILKLDDPTHGYIMRKSMKVSLGPKSSVLKEAAYLLHSAAREKRAEMMNALDNLFIDLLGGVSGLQFAVEEKSMELLRALDNLYIELLVGASGLQFAVQGKMTELLNAFVDHAFELSDEPNICFAGNFAPVEEIGVKTPVKIIFGEIPHDFPAGVCIRNGPNPLFGGRFMKSAFGELQYQWFEGDAMLHATYFDVDGSIPTYLNKFVHTHSYKLEKDREKYLYLPGFEGEMPALLISLLLNQIRFNTTHKWSCNTSVFRIGEKLYAGMEAGQPLEINPEDLTTVDGYYSVHGSWHRGITAHPKKDLKTGETVITGFQGLVKPYLELGVISSDGLRLVHKVDLQLNRRSVVHDLAITEKYNIIMDWPLVGEVSFSSECLMGYCGESSARVGILPRYGDATTLRWFPTDSNYSFHVVNSFDEGDEVVLHALSSRAPFNVPQQGMENAEWFMRGFTTCKIEEACDPWVDGALFTRLHEWRINLKTNSIVERDLTGDNFSLEVPKINEKFTGRKNRYAYAGFLDLEGTQCRSMPLFGGMVKMDFDGLPIEGVADGSKDLVKVQVYNFGPSKYGSEPMFVPREGGIEEDDGWVMTYVHDELTNISEMIILDAQNFESGPIVQLQLPQRVPYGFHGDYVLRNKIAQLEHA